MTTDGGNWKDLLRAASQGGTGETTVDVVQYHLLNGADPNFQHPEYMTTPLIEACRVGNAPVVRMLLERGNADPTLAGDLDGATPLEVAMECRHHAVVDILLKALSSSSSSSPPGGTSDCQAILITGTYHRDIIAHLLSLGHRVLVGITEGEAASDSSSPLQTLEESLKKETGNSKLWFQSASNLPNFILGSGNDNDNSNNSSSLFGTTVHAWVHKIKNHDALLKEVVSTYRDCAFQKIMQQQKCPGRIFLLLESTSFLLPAQEDLSFMLAAATTNNSSDDDDNNHHEENRKDTTTAVLAMLEPTSWWDTMTYGFWYDTWLESTSRLLGLGGLVTTNSNVPKSDANGKLYTYSRQCVAQTAVNDVMDDDKKEWKEAFVSMIQEA